VSPPFSRWGLVNHHMREYFKSLPPQLIITCMRILPTLSRELIITCKTSRRGGNRVALGYLRGLLGLVAGWAILSGFGISHIELVWFSF